MANKRNIIQTLKTRRDFLSLKEKGKKIKSAPWFFVTILPNREENCRVGFVITKKVGNAVARNRLRRWSKEYLRKKLPQIKTNMDIQILFLPQSGDFYRKLEFAEFSERMDKIFEKIS